MNQTASGRGLNSVHLRTHLLTSWLTDLLSKEYRKEILFPVMQFIARQHGQSELYEGLISDLDPLAMPRGASEMEVKMRQVRELQVSNTILKSVAV